MSKFCILRVIERVKNSNLVIRLVNLIICKNHPKYEDNHLNWDSLVFSEIFSLIFLNSLENPIFGILEFPFLLLYPQDISIVKREHFSTGSYILFFLLLPSRWRVYLWTNKHLFPLLNYWICFVVVAIFIWLCFDRRIIL